MPFKTLTLGGGGTKGVFHFGILLELQKHQELNFPGGVYGVSVGSIIATYIAFGLPVNMEIFEKMNHMFSPAFFIEEVDFPKLANSYTSKGLFTTDHLCRSVSTIFLYHGIDIRTAKLSDAKMPLYIFASNLTKGKPTIFKDNVLLIDAIRCSCAVPGIFQPQVLYDEIYIDGDMFCPSLDYFVEDKTDLLSISLKCGMLKTKFTSSNIDEISPLKYMHDMYTMITRNFHSQTKSDRTLMVSYPNFSAMSDIKDFDREDVLKKCSETLRSFLFSKNLL
jgi:predicted acylesterase/phospholipase RssA